MDPEPLAMTIPTDRVMPRRHPSPLPPCAPRSIAGPAGLALFVGMAMIAVPIAGQNRSSDPVSETEAKADETERVLVMLAGKANGGDEKAARALAAEIFKITPVAMEDSFRNDVETASRTEANRILGVTLLRTGSRALEARGLACIDEAIEGQSALAMEFKATALLEGRFGLAKSADEAVKLLKAARQLPGAAESHRLLGELALVGAGMPKDPAIALEYFRRGVEAGALSCSLALHRLFREGRELPKDLVEAERYGRAAAEGGDAVAAYEMGIFYERYSAGAPEWLRAGEWMRKAADQGNVAAILRLADYQLGGSLGSVNSDEGIRLLRAAAGDGSPEAAFRIGESYREGVHLPQDAVASTAWFRVAAELGDAPAANAYGLSLATGNGVRSDPVAAAEWFRIAADQGNLDAKVNLGELHQHGVGLERDPDKARTFFKDAALQGSAVGAQKLAELLAADGGAASPDPAEAAYWAARSVALGNSGAADLASRLRARLSATQLSELERRLAAAIKPTPVSSPGQ